MAVGDDRPGVETRGLGRWYDVVRRLCDWLSKLDMPSVGDPSGDGIAEVPTPLPSAPGIGATPSVWSLVAEPEADEGVVDNVETACSVMAVVGTALMGIPLEKRDEADPRDVRDVGRRGEGWLGMWLFTGRGSAPGVGLWVGRVGEGGGTGDCGGGGG